MHNLKSFSALAGSVLAAIAAFITICNSIAPLSKLTSFVHWMSLHMAMGGEEVIIWLQAAAILLFVISLSKAPDKNTTEQFKNAIAATKQFTSCWGGIWYSLLLLYVLKGLKAHFLVAQAGPFIVFGGAALEDFLAGLAGAFLLLCYVVMVVKSVPTKDFDWQQIVTGVLAVPPVLLLVEFLIWNGSLGHEIEQGVSVLYGIGSGVALALLVGRLESRIFAPDIKIWAVTALYFYAMLQMVAPQLVGSSAPDLLASSVLSLLLLLKILFFLSVERLIKRGDLTYYMLQYRKLLDEGFGDRQLIIAQIRG